MATPIETQVNGTPGMTYLQSNSTNDGRLSLNVNFDVGTDINIAALDVQNRVGIAQPQLPEEVTRLGVTVAETEPESVHAGGDLFTEGHPQCAVSG